MNQNGLINKFNNVIKGNNIRNQNNLYLYENSSYNVYKNPNINDNYKSYNIHGEK